MNCEETDMQLSEFLDRTLDGDYFRNVREHLAGCPRCSEELAGLAECRRLVSNLGIVEPPVGLVTRVMADVREAAHRPGILERLFPPIRLKIPLQAAAVVLIGILSVYLYQKEDTSNSPLTAITPEPLSVQQESTRSETAKPPAAPINSPLPNEAKAVSTELATAKAPSAPAATASKAGIAESRLESRQDKFKSAPIPAQGVTTAQKGSSFPGGLSGGRGIGSSVEALRQPGVRPAPFPADRLSLLSEPIPDYELVVRRLPSQRADQATPAGSQDSLQNQAGSAASKSPEARRQAEGSSRGNNSPLEILWFSVPYDRYEQFKKELAAQAIVESEIPVAIKEKDASFIADRPLSIKVTVLPSAER